MFQTSLRISALLVLVYPATQAVDAVRLAIQYGEPLAYLDRLPLFSAFLASALGLRFAQRWAHTLALSLSTLSAGVLGLLLVDSTYTQAITYWPTVDRVQILISIFAGGAAILLLLLPGSRAALPKTPSDWSTIPVAVSCLAAGIVLMGLITVFGLGGLFSREWYQVALYSTQLPGIALLRQMGLCCGYDNPAVISDVVDLHWGGLTRIGIPILILSNAIGILLLTLLTRSVWHRLRARVRAAPHGAA